MSTQTDNSSLILNGIAVAPGLACGKPFLLPKVSPKAQEKFSPNGAVMPLDTSISVDLEVNKLVSAFTMLSDRLHQLFARAQSQGRNDEADIINFHITVLEDEALFSEAKSLISEVDITAAEAISRVFSKQIRRFEQIEDDMIRSKALDLYDILNSVLLFIHAEEEALITIIPENSIIIADDLSPSQLIALPSDNIAGIVCEHGDAVSHTAVLAAGLQIPAVFCCDGILSYCASLSEQEEIIVDGNRGKIMKNQEACGSKVSFASVNVSKGPAQTADGIRLELLANIVNLEEYERSADIYFDGTGLLRTETLFAGSSIEPDEELQFMRYRQAVMLAGHNPGPHIIRTFDLAVPLGSQGARLDIVSERHCSPYERGLGRSLRQSEELRTQLRAIIRACAGRECSILFPLVMSADDYVRAVNLAEAAHSQLLQEGFSLPSRLKIGAMIETPEAVNEADKLFELADFVSIGSNDLAAYTQGGLFANENVEMIKRLTSRPEVTSGQKRIILCGELAASPELLPVWLKLGIRSFSINILRMEEFKKTAAALNSDGSKTASQIQTDHADA